MAKSGRQKACGQLEEGAQANSSEVPHLPGRQRVGEDQSVGKGQ